MSASREGNEHEGNLGSSQRNQPCDLEASGAASFSVFDSILSHSEDATLTGACVLLIQDRPSLRKLVHSRMQNGVQ